MPAPTIYRSSDASAPVLDGTAGSLIKVLRGCLVDGYTGKAAAGWTMAYSDGLTPVQRADFRQAAGNQFYLDVDDRGASSVLTGASGKEAAVRGYEAMTALGTGTNPFPTTAQVAANSANWRKSASADSVARGWLLAADDRSFILVIADGDLSTNKVYYFGDVYALKPADAGRTCIMVRTTANTAAFTGSLFGTSTTTMTTNTTGFYYARAQGGAAGSLQGGYVNYCSNPEGAIPAPALDGNIYLYRLLLSEGTTNNVLRGWFRGLYGVMNTAGINDGDTFTGGGDMAGRSFLLVKGLGGTAGYGVAIETSTWDTSS